MRKKKREWKRHFLLHALYAYNNPKERKPNVRRGESVSSNFFIIIIIIISFWVCVCFRLSFFARSVRQFIRYARTMALKQL